MHRVGVTALALSLVTGLTGIAAASAAPSGGDHVYPSKQQVHHARHQAARAADDVAGIKAAARAGRPRCPGRGGHGRAGRRAVQRRPLGAAAGAARRPGRRPARPDRRRRCDAAAPPVRRDRGHVVRDGSVAQPARRPAGQRRDLPAVINKMSTLQNAQAAMDHTYDSYTASSTLAGVARDQADAARAKAATLATQAKAARDQAASAAAAADQASQDIAARKTHLIHRLAKLQHVSVSLAQQRQAGIERAARWPPSAPPRRRHGRRRPSRPPSRPQTRPPRTRTTPPHPAATRRRGHPGRPNPHPPRPTPRLRRRALRVRSPSHVARSATRTSGAPPGPNAWDCSGLTMGAWRAGGISLPHYSVAQYAQSTPISSGSAPARRPGLLGLVEQPVARSTTSRCTSGTG